MTNEIDKYPNMTIEITPTWAEPCSHELLRSYPPMATYGYGELVQQLFDAKKRIKELESQVVMKFSEERVPEFSQGFRSHELLEPVTAEDCAHYVAVIELYHAMMVKE